MDLARPSSFPPAWLTEPLRCFGTRSNPQMNLPKPWKFFGALPTELLDSLQVDSAASSRKVIALIFHGIQGITKVDS